MRRQRGQSWRLRELRRASDERAEIGRRDNRKPERRDPELRRQSHSSLINTRRHLTANFIRISDGRRDNAPAIVLERITYAVLLDILPTDR